MASLGRKRSSVKRPWEPEWVKLLTDELKQSDDGQETRSKPDVVCPIFRVRKRVRDLTPKLFEPEILQLGLLHRERFQESSLIEKNLAVIDESREDLAERFEGVPTKSLGCFLITGSKTESIEEIKERDETVRIEASKSQSLAIEYMEIPEMSVNESVEKFKLDMATEFFTALKKSNRSMDWKTVCEAVVPDPAETQKAFYELRSFEHAPDNAVRCALTLDAVILVQFGSVREFISLEEGRHFSDVVFLDMMMLENQIPLPIIRQAMRIRFDLKDKEAEFGALRRICKNVLKRIGSSIPGFHSGSTFSSLKVEDFNKCEHLLSCLSKLIRAPVITEKSPTQEFKDVTVGELGNSFTTLGEDLQSSWTGFLKDSTESYREQHGVGKVFYAVVLGICLCFLLCVVALVAAITVPLMLVYPFILPLVFVAGMVREIGVSVCRFALFCVFAPLKSVINLALRRFLHVYEERQGETDMLPCAMKLRDAGVRFKGITNKDHRGGQHHDFVPIFRKGWFTVTLSIPSFSIRHFTESIWRNLMAFEMKDGEATNFIYYMQFMDEMINTEKDVHLLSVGIDPVIIENSLSKEQDVANLFNSILQSYKVDDSEDPRWIKLRKDINNFYNDRSSGIFYEVAAKFIEPYIDKPWLVLSLIVAIVLLVLTLLQTVYSVLAFYGL